jgi:general secretion pathway protein E/type IV pilus assembly protein PilB
MASTDDYLIDLLTDMGFVSKEQLEQVREEADAAGEGLVDTLLSKADYQIRRCDPSEGCSLWRGNGGIGELRLPDEVIAAVPRHIAKKYNVVPVAVHEGTVTVAISDPSIWIRSTA